MYYEKSCQHGEKMEFYVPDKGGYIYNSTISPGILGKQLCRNGRYAGSTLSTRAYHPDKVDEEEVRKQFERKVDRWVKRRRRYWHAYGDYKGPGKCWCCGAPV